MEYWSNGAEKLSVSHERTAMEDHNALKTHALSWIDGWNRHDVEAILSHYADDQK